MKKLLKIFAVMFIVSVALLAVAAYVPNGDVADAVTADCTHEYSEVVLAQQPSCTQKGWLEHYTCTLCGKYFVKVGEDMVEVDWEDISSPVLVHKWSDWFVKPATCTEEGGEMRYCALCGATEHRGDPIDALGHTYGNWTIVTNPTLESIGRATHSCTNDGCTHSETVDIPTLSDTATWTVKNTTQSTCTVAGNTVYTSMYGEVTVTLPLDEHTYGELIEEVSATCTAVGTKAHYKCSVCHKLFVDGESGKVEVSAEELVIPTTGHNLTHHEAVESTCEVAGNSEYWSCDRCGLYFSDGQGSQPIEKNSWMLPLAEHTEETIHGKAATCTETGLTDGVKCSVCGTVLVAQQEIPATGHTYDAVTTGNNVCTVCDQHEITQAEIVEKLYALERGEALDGTYLLTGIVTNVDGTNATIIVEEKDIYLYSFQSTDAFLVGDRVSVVGTLKHFGNYYEFDKGTVTEVTHPEYTLTFGANVEGYTVTLADGSSVPTSATNGTTYEVKITVPSGYKVASVTVNETVVDMSESGTYSVTVCGETTVHVEIVSKMFSGMVLEATVDSLGLTSTSYASNNGEHIVGNYTVTTNQIMLQSGVMQWQKNKGSLTVEGTFDKIVVNYTSDGLFTLKVNGVEVEADTSVAGVLTFDLGTSQTGTFVIEVGNEKGKTTSIQFFATICEHEWLAWTHKSDATCTESATESRICDLCGAEEVRTVGEPLGHTWGDWTSNGNNTHTGKCSLCGEKVSENCTFVDGKCEVCHAQEVITHSVTVGYTVNGNAATTLPEGVTVEILGEDGQSVTDLANVVEGTTLKVKITAEGFDIAVTCNSESLTLQDGEGTFDVNVDVTLSVTLTTKTEHKGTAEDPYSVADALAIAGAIGQGNYTEKVYIKGLVIDAGEKEKEGSYLSNIYIADTADGTKMLVFSANFSEEVPSIYEGDTVVFHGYITNYEGILEIAPHGDYVYMTAVTRGFRPIAVKMENATTTLPDSAPIESTVTFTVTANEGYDVVSVKVNGNFITPVEGTYSFVVGETNAVVVTTQVITPKHQVSVNGDVKGYTVTTDNDITLPGEVYEGTLKFTVTAPEGYQVATVSVGETVLTLGDDGYYTTEVAGEITINITFSEVVVLPTELLTELTFPDDNQVNNKVSAYDKTWKAIKDGHEWTISNFNNNTWNDSWTYIKAGRKNYDSIATITIPFAEQISKVVVTVDKVTASKINSFKLIVAIDEKFENIVEEVEVQPIVTGDIEFALTKPGANLYYKIEVDCASASSNGIIQISKIAYWHVVCDHSVETWTPNNNGTHTGTCSLCGQEITEDCTYNEEHKCSVCGYAEPTRTVTVNFDETNESSTFGNYQWVNENGDVVEAPGDVYAGTVLYLKVSVNDYATHTISEVKATDTTLTVVSEDDGSKTYKFVVGTGDITITIAFEEVGVATKSWKLVTVNEQLYDGMQFVMVYKEIVAGSVVSNKYYSADESSVFGTDEITTLADTVTTFTLKASGTNWQIFDNVQQKYIVNGSTSNATLSWNAEATTKHTIFSIDIVDGEAEIKCTTQTNQYLQYNASLPRFGNYKGTMQNVCIYAYM